MSPASPGNTTDFERSSGLGRLKSSFLLYLIGALLAIVPVVGVIGGLVEFGGLVFLIMGWRALGRSSLASAQNYKSTGRWLVYFIIISIVGSFAGFIVLIASVVGSMIISGAAGNPSSFTQGPAFQTLTTGIAVIIAAILAGEVLVYNKVRSSMGLLSAELSQPSLATAGWLFLLSVVVGLGATALDAVATYAGVTTYGSTAYVPYYLATLAGDFVVAAAGYVGYKGFSRVA